MRRRTFLAAPTLLVAPALAATPLVVAELFTSQSCSSCPPADALLGEIAARPDVLALAFHVTYWDRAGWRDPFSLPEATDRQRRYAATLSGAYGRGQLYTPQLVVQGRRDVVGSDREAVLAALSAVEVPRVALSAALHQGRVVAQAGAGEGLGTLWLIGYDARHETQVQRGENAGRRLVDVNVVRSIERIGAWSGAALRAEEPKPAGEHVAVLLQGLDGVILGAARV
ncbi:DUF1223 domain-containing protein [Roseococcus sp. YIM B11640]|uniref:DUF1223 domain-containing protein n=1 Tax=Roseococcus sp. YIM B11640 TaxID=3133973 RepID=UPI003C7D1D3E